MKENKKTKKKINIKNRKGITLIALVITIIVLLILAGVSIAMLTGNNGILTQAQESKTRTDKASIIEQVQVDILGKQAENNSGDVLSTDLEEILKKYFSNEETNIKNIVEGTTGEGEETKLISKEDNNIKIDLSEIYSGEIKKVILAKDVLIPNEEGETLEEKSPYVLYNNLLCRVLYNDDTHGLQIITDDNIKNEAGEEEKVTLGYNDPTVTADDFIYKGTLTLSDKFKKAAASYNNAVNTLSKKAEDYKGTKAIDARSVGSIATLENGEFQGDTSGMFTGTEIYLETYSLNGIFKNTDTNYNEDVTKIKNLGINATSNTLLASRNVNSDSSYTTFYVRYLNTSGGIYDYNLCGVRFSGNMGIGSPSYGFRPVFLLSSDIQISSGSGSSEDPYVIE